MPSYHTSQAKITHLKEYLIMKNQNNTQAELQSQIDSLNSDVYDHLTLHGSNLDWLSKIINTAINDLSQHEDNPKWAMREVKRSLFMAQYLIDEFEYHVNSDIEAHPLYEREGKV